MNQLPLLSACLLSLSMAFSAKAEDKREHLQIGAKLGFTYSNVYDAQGESFNADSKLGLAAGAFLRIPLGKFIGLQPEVLLTQKGFKGNGTLLGSGYTLKRTSTFFEIPVLVAFKPVEFLTILAGPQFSYLVHQRDEITSSLTSFAQEQEFKQDNYRKNIMGIVGGADININPFVISARMGWDVQTNKGDGTSSTPRYKNVCTSLCVGFVF